MAWTRISDPETVGNTLPAWLGRRMLGVHGSFGLLLTTGDVLRVRSLAAACQSSDGAILLDVLLDHPGIPDGVDLAWRTKHFLGAPVPGATLATVNLSQVVAAVEFVMAEMAVDPSDRNVPFTDEVTEETEAPPVQAVGQTTG